MTTTTTTKTSVCPNPACTNPRIEEIDDKRVCASCFALVSDSNIVSEVQFGESASGAAVLQGSYVGADQTHARVRTGGAYNRVEGSDSREIRDANGKGECRTPLPGEGVLTGFFRSI